MKRRQHYLSADNGIYILKTRDNQYRVIHAQGISLNWSFLLFKNTDKLIPTRVIELFGQSRYTYNQNLARGIAFSMAEKIYTEYGISEIPINKTWKQIVKEAKEFAPLEIEAINNHGNDGRWDYSIAQLKAIIDM
jgi:hypothetical protein